MSFFRSTEKPNHSTPCGVGEHLYLLTFCIVLWTIFLVHCTEWVLARPSELGTDGDGDTDGVSDGDADGDSDGDGDGDSDGDADGDADGDSDGDTDVDADADGDNDFDADIDSDADGDADDGGCVPASELCNGVDDDCDDVIDNGAACPCPIGYFGGHAYLFCDDRVTWQDARDYCYSYGYTLVTVEDAVEHDTFLAHKIELYELADAWTGLNDLDVEGLFVWLSTGASPVYTNWAPDEPNGGETENCVQIRSTFRWNDKRCSFENPFICEAE